MLNVTAKLLLRSTFHKSIQIRLVAATAEAHHEQILQSFRTPVTNPTEHNSDHLARLYSIPKEDKTVLFQHGGLPKIFATHIKTFNETCLMVREPALDIINCLKTIDYNKPVVRFVLYGQKGTGKSLSLAHIIHYAYLNDYLIVHVPWVGNWMRRPKDNSNSETKQGFMDLNIDAAAWLLHFKTQNAKLLKNPDLKISREIHWTKRETTPKDSTLTELIEHGINRIRFASNCINILAEEIKLLSCAGLCKTLVAIDGFNAFFYPKTRVFADRREIVPPNRITLTEGFLNLTKFDWKNAAVVVTVDELVIAAEDQTSHLPRYLLGKTGFEHLDPFIPVEVTGFSKKEHQSIMDYFRERKWIQPYQGIDEELYFLSNGNPFYLLDLVKSY
ncbi:hypothetical protein ABEB36_000687 [Hypothenemus hampei]|uniref:Small ribosomal subunit protein mS29 n=1 Tax=Hypothenemus hampei TaxID=57062 RepID=A0ABD1FC33_HYPHA